MVEQHPVQIPTARYRDNGKLPRAVTEQAYKVYCHVHRPQPAMMDLEGRGCRGGFSTGEIIAFLYAATFPKCEWRKRVDEAWNGMENL